MAQNGLVLRAQTSNPLPINTIDGNLTYLQDVALASSNSLQYRLTATYTPYPSATTLPFAYPTYFNSRMIGTPSSPNIKSGNQVQFQFSTQTLQGTSSTFWSYLYGNRNNKLLSLNQLGFPQNGWKFKINSLTSSVSGTFSSWIVNTSYYAGPTANYLPAPDKYMVSWQDYIPVGGPITLNKTTEADPEEGFYNYTILVSQETYISLDINPILSGDKLDWVQELEGLYNSGQKQNVSLVSKSDPLSTLVFKLDSFSYYSDTKLNLLGTLVNQTGDPIEDAIFSLKTPYNPAVPLINNNSSFWSFQGTSASSPSPGPGEFYNQGDFDEVIVGENYIFDFSQYDASSTNLDYLSWFDHLYNYGNSGQSVLHLTEYNTSNTSPTNSYITRGNFIINSFDGSVTKMNVTCLSGEGSLSTLLFGGGNDPKLYNVSYTLVSTGSASSAIPTREDVFTSVTFSSVTHNFGYYPTVQILNENGEVFIPQSIVHASTASFDVYFSQTSSGTIISSGGGGNLDNSLILTPDLIPSASGDPGYYGETRLGLSGSTPYLYVYTDQWYRFMGATF